MKSAKVFLIRFTDTGEEALPNRSFSFKTVKDKRNCQKFLFYSLV